MTTVTLEIEDSQFEQFMGMINLLKSDVVKHFEVKKTAVDLASDPMAQELKKRIQEIDEGSVELIPHSEVMNRIYAKWEAKCM